MAPAKKFLLVIISLFFTGISNSGAQTITDPVEYNDYIVDLQNDIGNELLILVNMLSALPEDKSDMTAQLQRTMNSCDTSIARLNKLKPIANEFGIKKSALELFRFYKSTMSVDYAQMIDELYNETPSPDNLNAIVTKVTTNEAVVDANFSSAQEAFAKYHNIDLAPNELQDQFEEE